MSKIVKIILIIAVLALLIIDIYGIWKYKFSGTEYKLASSDSVEIDENNEEEIKEEEPIIEYQELTKDDFSSNEKLFITDIEQAPGPNSYIIRGLLYEEYWIESEEFYSVKNGQSTIEIFGIEYEKERYHLSNVMLKPVDENIEGESLYLQYSQRSRRYVVKDAVTDYVLYRPTDRYLETTVSSDLQFVIQKNNKSEKLTVADVVDTHKKLKPQKNQVKMNYSTIEFSRSGEIDKVTELNF